MTEEKLTKEIIDLANNWYEGDIREDEFHKQVENLVKIDRYEQLIIKDVMQHSKLLVEFAEWILSSEEDITIQMIEKDVNTFLSNNSA